MKRAQSKKGKYPKPFELPMDYGNFCVTVDNDGFRAEKLLRNDAIFGAVR
jgi:hypothetical protein